MPIDHNNLFTSSWVTPPIPAPHIMHPPQTVSPFHIFTDELELSSSMEEYIDTIDDFRIKYDNCFGIMDGKLIKVNDFYHDDESSITMNTHIYNNGCIINTADMNVLDIENIIWSLPNLGAVNIDDTVVFINRKHKQNSPTRYRKGFRYDLMNIFEPTSKEFHIIGRELYESLSSSENKVATSLFFRKEMSVEEALDSVLSLNRIGAAFNEKYYFTLSASINSVLLWRNNFIIGVYGKTSKSFKLNTSLFDEELKNLNIPLEA